jgi:DNA-binding transcriptional ArsR family regulator
MKPTQVIASLGAFAHEHRLAIYRLLVTSGSEGLNAGAVADRVRLVPSSLTFHLQNLQRAGLVTQRHDGRQFIYSADFSVMNALVGYLTENCCGGPVDCGPRAPARAARTRKSRATALGVGIDHG